MTGKLRILILNMLVVKIVLSLEVIVRVGVHSFSHVRIHDLRR